MKHSNKAILSLAVLFALVAACAAQNCLKDCCQTLKTRPKQTYTYYQKTGQFVGGTKPYNINTKGYSGQGAGLNNPSKQCVVNTGPLPVGKYTLDYCKDTMHDPPVTRPCSFYLKPDPSNNMCGRSAFFVHGCQCCTSGDTTTPPAAGCSAGCIVINQESREQLRVGDILIVKSSPSFLDQIADRVTTLNQSHWLCHYFDLACPTVQEVVDAQ